MATDLSSRVWAGECQSWQGLPVPTLPHPTRGGRSKAPLALVGRRRLDPPHSAVRLLFSFHLPVPAQSRSRSRSSPIVKASGVQRLGHTGCSSAQCARQPLPGRCSHKSSLTAPCLRLRRSLRLMAAPSWPQCLCSGRTGPRLEAASPKRSHPTGRRPNRTWMPRVG